MIGGSGSAALARSLERGRKMATSFMQCADIEQSDSFFGKLRQMCELDSALLASLYIDGYAYGHNAARFANLCVQKQLEKLHSLSEEPMLSALFMSLQHKWQLMRPNVIASMSKANADIGEYAFFYDEEKQDFFEATDPKLKKSFLDMLTTYAQECEKAFMGCHVEEILCEELEKNENSLTDASMLSVIQTRLAQKILCAFMLYFGYDNFSEQAQIKKDALFKKNVLDPNIFRTKVKLTTEYDDNLGKAVETLPELTTEFKKYCGTNLLQDHLCALVNRMVGVNLTTLARFKFSVAQSDELNNILEGLSAELGA